MKKTKSILLISIIASVLCAALCIGVTYAFFIDEMTSKENVVQSGRLDYDLKVENESTGEWSSIKKNPTLGFSNGTWSAGQYEVKVLKLQNVGTLALKWQAKLQTDGLSVVAKSVQVYVQKSDTEITDYPTGTEFTAWEHKGTLDQFLQNVSTIFKGELKAGESTYFAIALYIPSDATIEHPELPLGSFNLEFDTLQLSFESDFFDNQYDADLNFTSCAHQVETTTGIEATCTVAGYTESQQCTLCPQVFIEKIVLPTNGSHTPSAAVIENNIAPTCTTDGSYDEVVYCAIETCKAQISRNTVTVPKSGHTADEPVKENIVNPVLNANGTVTNGSYDSVVYCSECNAEISREEVEIQVTDLTIDSENRRLVGYTDEANLELSIPGLFEKDGNWYRTVAIGDEAFYNKHTLASVTIPRTVTSIGVNAFGSYSGSSILSSVAFEENSQLKTIGQYAFRGCKKLTTITIPDGVTTIDQFAFKSSGLTSITLPNSVTKLYPYVFMNCRFTEFTIPDSITYIGSNAFNACYYLESVTIPSSVKTIEGAVFLQCESLTEVKYTGTVESWKKINFKFTWYTDTPLTLTHVICTDGYVHFRNYAGETAIDAAVAATCTATGLTEGSHCTVCNKVLVAQTVTAALGHTWVDATCTAPKTCSVCGATEGSALGHTEVIDAAVAATCAATGLTEGKHCSVCSEVLVAQTVTEKLGHTAGEWTVVTAATYTQEGLQQKKCTVCSTVLEEEAIPKLSPFKFSDNGDGTYTVVGFKEGVDDADFANLVIPATYEGKPVTAIGESAFQSCTNLVSVKIPDTVTTIGKNAFNGCEALANVIIPNSVTSIGVFAFQSCESLTNVTLPNALETIGNCAFMYCGSLESIHIPSTVTSLGTNGAFWYCTSLRSVTFGEDSQIKSIPNNTFLGCQSLTSIVIPNGVNAIGGTAFREATSLVSITIPSSVKNIGSQTFYDAKNLKEITFEGTVDQWDDAISKGDEWNNGVPAQYVQCSNGKFCIKPHIAGEPVIEDVVNPVLNADGTVTNGSYNSVVYCSVCGEKLSTTPGEITVTDLTIDSSNRGLVGYTEDANLKLDIPDLFEKDGNWYRTVAIGRDAFNGCANLTSVTIPNSVTSIGIAAFAVCTGLTEVTIPNSVTAFGTAVFRDCKNLKKVELSKNITTIDNNVFLRCENLTSIHIPDKVKEIKTQAFYGCKNLESIKISKNLSTIHGTAFENCDKLESVYFDGTVAEWNNRISKASIKHIYCSDGTIHLSVAVDAAVAATCTTTGLTEGSHCSACSEVLVAQTVTAALGHTWVDATCTAPKTCSVCGATEGSALGHTAGAAATCTTAQTCTVCGEVLTAALGHTEVTVSGYDPKMDSDQASGRTDGKQCSVCGVWTVPQEKVYWGVITQGKLETLGIYTGAENETVEIPQYYRLDEKLYKTKEIDNFRDCTNLASIILPEGVVKLGSNTFSNCTNLKSITIPTTLTRINDGSFKNCTSLEAVYITDVSAWCKIDFWNYSDNNPLKHAGNLYLNGELVTDLVIPDDVKTIYKFAFYGCTSLKSVTIGDGITELPDSVFLGCKNLESVVIGNNVDSISMRVFSGCSSLKSATFKNTDGWVVAASVAQFNNGKMTAITVTDQETAATYLTSTHVGKIWRRLESTD